MNSSNPFYVQPGGDWGTGLSGLAGTIMDQTEKRKAEEKELLKAEKYAKIKTGVIEAMRSGDYMKMLELSISNPEISQAMSNTFKMQSGLDEKEAAIQEKEYSDSLFQWVQDPTPEMAQRIIEERKDLNLPGSDSFLERLQANPEQAKQSVMNELAIHSPKRLKAFYDAQPDTGEGQGQTAEVQTFDYLTSGLSPEETVRAKRVKLGLSPRASEDAVSKAMKAMAVETAKLQARLGLEPRVAGAVAAAKNQARVESDEGQELKSKDTAWNVYNNSMSNLAGAMSGTTTGPGVGYIPAVTANAQIADGAMAVMAPVLKQMFRSSGEGVFTDKDQELLMKMVPTRNDLPEARAAKIRGIDDVVRAKLGKAQGNDDVPKEQESEAAKYKEGQTATGPGGQKLIFKNGNWGAM